MGNRNNCDSARASVTARAAATTAGGAKKNARAKRKVKFITARRAGGRIACRLCVLHVSHVHATERLTERNSFPTFTDNQNANRSTTLRQPKRKRHAFTSRQITNRAGVIDIFLSAQRHGITAFKPLQLSNFPRASGSVQGLITADDILAALRVRVRVSADPLPARA